MARSATVRSISHYLRPSVRASRSLGSSSTVPSRFSIISSSSCPLNPPDPAASFSSGRKSSGVVTCASSPLLRSAFLYKRSILGATSFSFSSPLCLPVTRSFFSGSHGESPPTSSVNPPPAPSDPPKDGTEFFSKEFMDAANNTVTSLKDAATPSIDWIHGSTEKVLLALQQNFDLPTYTSDTVTQLLYTTVAAVCAWLTMPRVFRFIHRYFGNGSYIIFGRSEKTPYEASMWSALEHPAKVLILVVAFSQLGSLIAPTTIASQYLHQIWKGSAVVCFVWFLHRWKGNAFSRMLADQTLTRTEREWILTLKKISSVGLFILGGMGVAETCGIAAQSVLTVGGVGGVATAFAARDILGNILSGFALQFMRPFSIGDTIKAGSVEGQVVDIGLTATQLLDNDKFPVAVPNSFFSSQAIVNKSRATTRSFTARIPVQLKDFEKVPEITQEVQNMLRSHSKVISQNGAPLCYAADIKGSSLDITLICNLAFKGKEDLLLTQQDIMLQTLKIIKSVGAAIGVPS